MSAPAGSLYSPQAQQVAADLGLKLGRANLDVFAETLGELASTNRSIIATTSDSRGSGKLKPFGDKFPRQIVECGIAEQNLVGVAAGLASTGKKVFAVSPACFLTARALEQLKNDVCYSDHPVALVGISAGVSYGALGTTHHSLHDLAVLRAINNLTILVPADAHETSASVRAAAQSTQPVYLRFGKAPLYELPAPQSPCAVGKASIVREGTDAALIGTGETVIHCLLAAAWLSEHHKINCRVISLHTIKPLDTAAIVAAGQQCGAVITAEEHFVHGGLGEAVASALMQHGVSVPFKLVGIPDEYTVTGSQADIFRHYGLSMESLAQTVLGALSPQMRSA